MIISHLCLVTKTMRDVSQLLGHELSCLQQLAVGALRLVLLWFTVRTSIWLLVTWNAFVGLFSLFFFFFKAHMCQVVMVSPCVMSHHPFPLSPTQAWRQSSAHWSSQWKSCRMLWSWRCSASASLLSLACSSSWAIWGRSACACPTLATTPTAAAALWPPTCFFTIAASQRSTTLSWTAQRAASTGPSTSAIAVSEVNEGRMCCMWVQISFWWLKENLYFTTAKFKVWHSEKTTIY